MICYQCGQHHTGHCSRMVQELIERIRGLQAEIASLQESVILTKHDDNVTIHHCDNCKKHREQTRLRVAKHRDRANG